MNARRSSAWLFASFGLVVVVASVSRVALQRAAPHASVASESRGPSELGGDGLEPVLDSLAGADARSAVAADGTSVAGERRAGATDALATPLESPESSESPILLAGTVYDELGAPLAGVELELELYGEDAKRVERAVSAADGRYAVRGEPVAPERARISRGGLEIVSAFGPIAVLRARKSGYAPTREVLDAFASDARAHPIVLQRGGSLHGRVLFDEFLERERFELRTFSTHDGWSHPIAADGTFEFVDLPAGFAELAVFYDERSIEWIDALAIPAGAACVDARLDPIDLRGALREWRVQLLRPDDTPLASTAVSFEWSGRDGELRGVWAQRTDGEGRCAGIVPSAVARTWLDVAGFQDSWLDVETTSVKLRAMPRVRFGVDPRASELFGRLRLEFDFVDRTTPSSLAARRASIGTDGEAELTFDVAGRYQLRWVPLELGSTALAWPEHVLEVLTEPAEQYFDLALTDAQLAELAAAVGR